MLRSSCRASVACLSFAGSCAFVGSVSSTVLAKLVDITRVAKASHSWPRNPSSKAAQLRVPCSWCWWSIQTNKGPCGAARLHKRSWSSPDNSCQISMFESNTRAAWSARPAGICRVPRVQVRGFLLKSTLRLAVGLGGIHRSCNSLVPSSQRLAISPSNWRLSAPSGSAIHMGLALLAKCARPSALSKSQPSRDTSINIRLNGTASVTAWAKASLPKVRM